MVGLSDVSDDLLAGVLIPEIIGLFRDTDLSDLIDLRHALPHISTSNCRNITTISSGLGLLMAISDPLLS